jgi:FAD/FMN-containing dehydrogenase
VRRDRLVDEIGDAGIALLRSLKRGLDPEGLCNPGVLLPGDDRSRRDR